MRRRARDLTTRARERIRAARGARSARLAPPTTTVDRAGRPIDFVARPPQRTTATAGAPAGRRWAAPRRARPTSTAPAASSGPPDATSPEGGRPRRPQPATGRDRRPRAAGRRAPSVLRTAAAWSWRMIVVIAGFYVLLYAAAYVAVVVVPVIVALLLAALLQPGAAALVRRGWPGGWPPRRCCWSASRWSPGSSRWSSSGSPPASPTSPAQVSQGLGEVQAFVVRTFPITRNQLEDAVTQAQDFLVGNQESHRHRRPHHGRHGRRGLHRPRPGAVHAVLLPQGRPVDLAVAGRPLPRATRGPTSTRRPAAPGGR